MNALVRNMMIGGSTIALVAAAPTACAWGQDATATQSGAAANSAETVVVSASRISIAGYEAPTPVSVVSADQLKADAYVDLGDSLRQLPALGASVSPDNSGNAGLASQGTAGLSELNMRNLGAQRTLVLFDGQRVVPSDVLGNEADLSTIPQDIVERVDVVTGGASAAWGSDAVGGVVNLIVNKNFTGFKADEELGQNSSNNHFQVKSAATWGDDFLGDRLHVEFSGVYVMSPDAGFIKDMPWFKTVTLFPGPAGGPTYVHTTSPVGSAQYAQGGLIASGPLKNTEFVDGGVPVPFNPGTTFNGLCVSCSPFNPIYNNVTGLVSVPYHSTTLFSFANYKIANNLGASVMLNYGAFGEQNISTNLQKVNTILSGNPFIPASIQSEMTALHLSSIPVGTNNMEGCDLVNTKTIDAFGACQSGDGFNVARRQLVRGVFTLNGEIGSDWSWTAYAQYGQVRQSEHEPADPLLANYNNAVDAVTVTAANVGTSGLPLGSIACRSTLTNPTNGCQPLNIFGNNVVPSSTLNYTEPGRVDPGIQDQAHWIQSQAVFSASAQGTLPWGFDAGPVAVAFGGEYHLSQERAIDDPQHLGSPPHWNNGNFVAFAGEYTVEEGFAEVDAPILKDSVVESLDFNAAGRITSYSTSGLVETWKTGLTSQITDDVRVRGLASVDIRAPDLYELFNPPLFSHNAQVDPKTGLTVATFTSVGGNPNLVPEVARTVSGGVVLTPSFLPGFNLSIDWYSITVHGAIFTASAAQTLQQCALGVQLYCNNIYYGLPQYGPAYPGALDYLASQPENASSQSTSGVDFQADYTTDLFAGTLNLHLVGNYMDKFTQTALGVTYDAAGELSTSSPLPGDVKLHVNLAATYNQGPWTGSVQGRFLGAAALNNYWVTGIDVDQNTIPAVVYLDLRAAYKWNDHLQLYASVNNVLSTSPPPVPSAIGGTGTNLEIYDGLGRMYHGGIRINID